MTNNAASEMKLRGALLVLGGVLDEHHGRIAEHYAHAIEKHPYFCDWVEPQDDTSEKAKAKIETTLAVIRGIIKEGAEKHTLGWDDLLNYEVWEVFDALAKDDKAQAVEELYDCVAVCLRAIDVLEGRQRLGKPKEMLPPCTCGGESATVERGTEPEGFAIMCSRCFRKTALHPSLALAEEEWRTMLTTNNTTTKEMKGGAE